MLAHMTHADMITSLGGPAAIARALGCSHTQPLRWARVGIPLKRWPEVVRLAETKQIPGITLETLARAACAAAA